MFKRHVSVPLELAVTAESAGHCARFLWLKYPSSVEAQIWQGAHLLSEMKSQLQKRFTDGDV